MSKKFKVENGIISTDTITIRISKITAVKRKFNLRGLFMIALFLFGVLLSILTQHYLNIVFFIVIFLPFPIFIIPSTKLIIYTDEKRRHSINAPSLITEKMYEEIKKELNKYK